MTLVTQHDRTLSPLLTVDAVALYMQVSTRTISRWWRAGQFPEPVRIGGSLRWRAEDLRNWLAAPSKRYNQSTNDDANDAVK